jgi:FkbM family methyltransferase
MLPPTMTGVPRQPAVHRLARRWALSGWRGSVAFWRLADRLAAWPPDGPVRVWPDLVIACRVEDYVAAAAYRGLYERAETRLFQRLLPPGRPGRLAVDVGANVGIHTALLSILVGAQGRVIAFEPAPATFAVLDRLVGEAPLRNVTVHPWAVGRAGGTGALRQLGGDTNTGLASLRPTPDLLATGEAVRIVRLDEVPELSHGEGIDLLKIDVEGFEAEVLAGAATMFDEGRVRAAVIEVSPQFGPVDFAVELVERLAAGYSAFEIADAGTLRRRPVLRPLTSADIAASTLQFNLLLARRDATADVRGLVA